MFEVGSIVRFKIAFAGLSGIVVSAVDEVGMVTVQWNGFILHRTPADYIQLETDLKNIIKTKNMSGLTGKKKAG